MHYKRFTTDIINSIFFFSLKSTTYKLLLTMKIIFLSDYCKNDAIYSQFIIYMPIVTHFSLILYMCILLCTLIIIHEIFTQLVILLLALMSCIFNKILLQIYKPWSLVIKAISFSQKHCNKLFFKLITLFYMAVQHF